MNSSKPITVLLADDHAMVRQGLRALLTAAGNFQIVGEASNGREAVDLVRTLRPAVVLLDIAMPLLNGLEATRQIFATNPAVRVIILSALSDDNHIESLSAAGAVGFIEKQTSASIVSQAIRDVVAGKTFFSPTIVRRLGPNLSKLRERDGSFRPSPRRLTSRESEVLQLVAEGWANKQIAGELKISVKTVEKHRQQLMNKLDIHETAGLTRHAIAVGVIESKVRVTLAPTSPAD